MSVEILDLAALALTAVFCPAVLPAQEKAR